MKKRTKMTRYRHFPIKKSGTLSMKKNFGSSLANFYGFDFRISLDDDDGKT